MASRALLVFLICVLQCFFSSYQAEYLVNPGKSDSGTEFDGITIVLLKGAKYCDRTTKPGDLLRVFYNASLIDGTELESNFGKSIPLEFVLGEGQVILGWEQGLQDMCAGEIRHLTIPAKYAYGDSMVGAKFPPRATLQFTVELISFEKVAGAPRRSNVFAEIDVNDDGILSKEEVTTYLRREGIHDKPGEAGFNSLLNDIFVEEDKDKDGLITYAEFGGKKHDEL